MEGLGYQVNIPLNNRATKVIDVKFINNDWYLLKETSEGFRTNISGKFARNQFGVGYWPDNHPKNPKNLIINITPSFRDYLAQGIAMTDQTNQGTQNPSAQINMGGPIPKGKKKDNNPEETGSGSLRRKPPDIFDGDRTKSKAFISV